MSVSSSGFRLVLRLLSHHLVHIVAVSQAVHPLYPPLFINAITSAQAYRLIPFKIGQPKKQIVSKMVERDFEREYEKLQKLEDQTKKLYKDMKKSTEADTAMSKAATKIAGDLLSNPLCEQDQAFLESVMSLDTAMKRMEAFNQEKVNQIQKTVIDPLKK
ncbi:bridging integrator 3 [Tachysurus ichikawai]